MDVEDIPTLLAGFLFIGFSAITTLFTVALLGGLFLALL